MEIRSNGFSRVGVISSDTKHCKDVIPSLAETLLHGSKPAIRNRPTTTAYRVRVVRLMEGRGTPRSGFPGTGVPPASGSRRILVISAAIFLQERHQINGFDSTFRKVDAGDVRCWCQICNSNRAGPSLLRDHVIS